MKIKVNCKAVAVAQTKKGSYKLVFVDENACIFTCYKKTVTLEEAELLELPDVREFEVNVSDVPFFMVSEERS